MFISFFNSDKNEKNRYKLESYLCKNYKEK